MKDWRKSLAVGVAAGALLTASSAVAQDRTVMRVWVGDEPPAKWNIAEPGDAFAGYEPGDLAEMRRIEAVLDQALLAYPAAARPFNLFASRGADFKPAQPAGDLAIVMMRTDLRPVADAGSCGSIGDSEYLTVPDVWFDYTAQATWPEALPELSIMTAVGYKRSQAYCADVLGLPADQLEQSEITPAVQAINGLGAGLGYYALGTAGVTDRYGHLHGGSESIPIAIFREGVIGLSTEGPAYELADAARRFSGLRRVDRPLFELRPQTPPDAMFWTSLGLYRDWDFLPTLLQSRADDLASDSSVRGWVSDALKSGGDPDLGLDRYLSMLHWAYLTQFTFQVRTIEGGGLHRREVWQHALVQSNDRPGCAPVELSLAQPAVELDLKIEPAASNCIAVSWTGKALDDELPPSFSIIADAEENADGLDALHLTADQNWSQPLAIEQGGETETVELVRDTPLIRQSMIVEDARSGAAVKAWEVVHKPDAAHADGGMTIVLTNVHPDGEDKTRPMRVRLTVGPGAHETRQSLTAIVVDNQRDPCRLQTLAPLVARQTHTALPSFHIAAIDPSDFVINGSFVAEGDRDLERRLLDCARIQVALGAAGGGVAGSAYASGPAPGSPPAICQDQNNELAALAAAAVSAAGGGFAGMSGLDDLQPQKISFYVEAEGGISGPGTYRARATADLEDYRLSERGLDLPSGVEGEGTITVSETGSGRLKASYSVTFRPQEGDCSPQLVGSISGDVETVAALPLVPNENRTVVGPRPIEMLGERVWAGIPVADRRRMNAEPRRTEAEQGGGEIAPPPALGPADGALFGMECPLTDAEVEAVLERLYATLPAQVASEYRQMMRDEPETGRITACLYKDAL